MRTQSSHGVGRVLALACALGAGCTAGPLDADDDGADKSDSLSADELLGLKAALEGYFMDPFEAPRALQLTQRGFFQNELYYSGTFNGHPISVLRRGWITIDPDDASSWPEWCAEELNADFSMWATAEAPLTRFAQYDLFVKLGDPLRSTPQLVASGQLGECMAETREGARAYSYTPPGFDWDDVPRDPNARN